VTGEDSHGSGRRRRVGFGYWRLHGETQAVSLILAGLVVLFALSIAHDEIVAEMIDAGWLAERLREPAEIVLGLVIFAGWSALTLAFATVIRESVRAGRDDDR
jgi:hypothetical protein